MYDARDNKQRQFLNNCDKIVSYGIVCVFANLKSTITEICNQTLPDLEWYTHNDSRAHSMFGVEAT